VVVYLIFAFFTGRVDQWESHLVSAFAWMLPR